MAAARFVLVLGMACMLSACRIGPRNVAPDRFNYNEAIARSNQEQLLSNLVRMRYSEPPVFLGVGSVLTQYVYSGRFTVNGATASETTAVPGWTVGGSMSGIYIERPTITYTPLMGQDFAQQLLAPISTEAVFAMVQSGWSPEELLKLTIESINDVDGRLSSARPTEADLNELRRFRRMIELLLAAAARHAVEMQRDASDQSVRHIVFAEDTDAQTTALVRELKGILGLDLERSRFRVTDRVIHAPGEITIRVRPLGAMLGLESRGVEVPAAHLEGGLAVPMTTPDEESELASLIRLRVRSQRARPTNAFVAIRYEEHWFFIADDDHQSKHTLGLLGYLLQIQSPQAPGVAGPVLTVPTG